MQSVSMNIAGILFSLAALSFSTRPVWGCNVKDWSKKDDFRDSIKFDDPLYYGTNITEFLGLCSHSAKPREFYVKSDGPEQVQETDCVHHQQRPKSNEKPKSKRNYTNIELFLLKEAQATITFQRDEIANDSKYAYWSIGMFFIPVLMGLYLIVKGHFHISHLNIPYISGLFEQRPDPTGGMMYTFFKWMKYEVLPESHPSMTLKYEGKQTEYPLFNKWCRYNADIERRRSLIELPKDPRKSSLTSNKDKVMESNEPKAEEEPEDFNSFF